jgi:aspartate aminotransferase
LPFRPPNDFAEQIKKEISFVKSFQYSPVAGFSDLRSKCLSYWKNSRQLTNEQIPVQLDCIFSNGAKHSIFNILATLIETGDEVIVLAPYWVSYPEMVQFFKGVPVVVKSGIYENYMPAMDDIKRAISLKTKAIILNSPNNPSGLHYSDQWMKDFSNLLKEHPEIVVISDEIYFSVSYFDPKPTYFYQHAPELLSRTIIVDGISKNLASTGLRLGYTICEKEFAQALNKLQGQTTSGANSLIQRALASFNFNTIEEYLNPIRAHLRSNAQLIRELYRSYELSHEWYQTNSAFYYLVSFSRTPLMKKFQKGESDQTDYSAQICEYLLEKEGLVLVPADSFGVSNAARISLVLEKVHFQEAMEKLLRQLSGKNI